MIQLVQIVHQAEERLPLRGSTLVANNASKHQLDNGSKKSLNPKTTAVFECPFGSCVWISWVHSFRPQPWHLWFDLCSYNHVDEECRVGAVLLGCDQPRCVGDAVYFFMMSPVLLDCTAHILYYCCNSVVAGQVGLYQSALDLFCHTVQSS